MSITSLWDEVRRLKIPYSHHESDLYLPATQQCVDLIGKYRLSYTTFISAHPEFFPGKMCLDVLFAYLPFWHERGIHQKEHDFHCAHCGGQRLEEVLIHAVVSTEVLSVAEDGDAVYGKHSVDDGDVDHYRCLECGSRIPDVHNTEELAMYLRARF